MKKLTLLSALFLLVMASCKKYEEGGSINKTQKNIVGKWQLLHYYVNDVDVTNQLIITNVSETYNDDKTCNRTYTDDQGDNISQNGTWSFDKENKLLEMSGIGSVETTASSGTASSSKYYILQLDKENYMYYYTNGSLTHKFHFTKQ